MHVLLVGPDLEENLSLRYLASSLRRAGHVAKIAPFDRADDAERVVAASGDADLIALSMCYQIRAPEFLLLARAFKALRPGRPVVAGGHFASCAARELLSGHPEIDVVAVHEGEQTLAELASLGALTPEALSEVPGIVCRNKGEIVSTPPRATVADLNTLPWPDRTGPARLMVGVPTAYMMGSRGCLYSCDYCCIATLHKLAPGKRFRQRTPDDIAAEMAFLYHERGVRQFIFHDDNFLVPSVDQNLERIDAIDRELRHRGVSNIGIVLKCRPAEVDRQVFARLREMGLLRVFLGIESGSAAGLASIGRRQSVDDEHRALGICEELGISTQYTIILFHPEATAKTMLDDLAFVREHAGHPLSFCRAEIYAGTPLEGRLIASSRAHGDYLARTYGYSDPVVARVWSFAKDLLVGRCFNEVNLMGQVIRLDHQAAVFRAFYEGRDAQDLVREFAALELDVNLDTAGLLEELVRACEEHCGGESLELGRLARNLCDRERTARAVFERRVCSVREALHEQAFAMIGLSPTPPARPVPGLRFREKAPMHAAAVLLAVGLLRCSESPSGVASDASVDAANAGAGGYLNQGGVMEAPPPPMGGSAGVGGAGGFMNQGGVMEAPPPPMGGSAGAGGNGGTPDSGARDAKSDGADAAGGSKDSGAGGFINQGGVMEAPPPPIGGRGGG